MNDEPTFRKFLWSVRIPYLWIVLIAIPLQFLVFKIQYPYPNFRGDSASYIAAAFLHADAAEWPVGYSKFLGFIHFFSHSDTLLVSIQYLLLELSALLFLFTLKYFIKPGKVVFNILFAFVVFNPLFLHLGNYIMSDALFISLSLLWITQLIWILYRPSTLQIIPQALLLLCLFTVRYNALFYPLVASLAFILSSLRIWVKIAGIVLSLILIGLFVGYTEHKFYELNGVRQFSPFGGWQLANNALYMYSNVQLVNSDTVPDRFLKLDSIVRQSFLKMRKKKAILNPYIRSYYIWDVSSPLGQYQQFRWQADTSTDFFIKWASMGPIYSAYGAYLIRKYPLPYFKFFIFPNVANFFIPPIEYLGIYNNGASSVDYRAQIWFDYKSMKITHASDNFEISIINFYPFFFALANIGFILSLLICLLFHEFSLTGRAFNHTIIVIAGFWLFNFLFSISASSIVLRYQVSQFLFHFSFLLILIEMLVKIVNHPKLVPQST
jgi:hypothetical protein